MFFSNKNIVVLCVSDKGVSLSEFRRNGAQLDLHAHASEKLPSGVVVHGALANKLAFTEALAKLLQKTHAEKKDAVFVLAEQQAYLSLLHFTQSKSLHEIIAATPREALGVIPLDPSNIYCDFFAIESAGRKGHSVVYAACDKKVANDYLEALTSLRLKPVFFAIEPDAFLSSSNISAQPMLFFVLGEDRSYWILAESGAVKKVFPSTVISSSCAEITQSLIETLCKEADAAIASELVAYITVPKEYFLWIASDSLRGKADRLADELQKKLLKKVSVCEPVFKENSNILQIAYGAARRFFNMIPSRGIDLLPVRFKEQAALLVLSSFANIISIILIIGASAFMSSFSYAMSEMYFDLQRTRREIVGTLNNVDNVRFREIKATTDRLNQEVSTLTQIQANLFPFNRVWKEIKKVIFAKGVTLTSMRFTDNDLEFQLTGIAKTRDELSGLTQKLKALPFVENVISPLSNFDKTTDISYFLTVKIDAKKIQLSN